MNNHQDWAFNSPSSQYRHASSSPVKTEQKVITTLALLTLGYYVLNFFDIWPSTIKRASFEWFVWLIPNRLVYVAERLMYRLGRLNSDVPLFKTEDFGNRQAKISALQRIVQDSNSPVRGVMRKARTLSGLDNVFRSNEERKPRGLGNWDNSCYQNSVLQGFASLPAFMRSVRDMNAMLNRAGDFSSTYQALDMFMEGLNEFSTDPREMWTPAILKSMDSWQQQDAQEYFSRVLDEIEKEMMKHQKRQMNKPGLENIRKRKYEDFKQIRQDQVTSVGKGVARTTETTKSTTQSTIPEPEEHDTPPSPDVNKDRIAMPGTMFRSPLDGMLAQGLECMTCGFTEGLSFTQFNCLTVNLGDGGSGTVEQLMDEYTTPEEIEGVECTNCTKLEREKHRTENEMQPPSTDELPTTTNSRMKPILRTKLKQITVGRLPTDLVIHINRSIFDMYGNMRKNYSAVGFPLRLEFLNRWCAPIDSSDDVQRTYELKCAVAHYGRHENGHYIAYGKREKDWYRFNDEIVSKVDLEDVLSAGNVFMLFYEAADEARVTEAISTPEVATTYEADLPSREPLALKKPLESAPGSMSEEIPGDDEIRANKKLPEPESKPTPTAMPVFEEVSAPGAIPEEILAFTETPAVELPAISNVSEIAVVDEPSSRSESTSASDVSDAVDEFREQTTTEPEVTIPVMRTATPASPELHHSDLSTSSIVQAL